MSHVYHQNPEMSGPGERSRAVRFEVPASGKGLKRTLDNPDPESFAQHSSLERNLPGRAEACEHERKAQADLHEKIAETWNESKHAGESWYKRMAGGAKDIAKAAGGLWREITQKNIDPEFKPENFIIGEIKDVGRGFKSMGGEDRALENGPGDWETIHQPNLLEILGEDLSIYDFGSTMLKGVKEIGLGARDAISEALTQKRAKEVKELGEIFSPTMSVADTYEAAEEMLGELIETNIDAIGLGHATTRESIEDWGKPENKGIVGELIDRKQELGNVTKFVLGGGFLSEVYSGIKDRITGAEKKSIENALRLAESEKPNPDDPNGGNREPLPNTQEIAPYSASPVREAYEGIREVARFHYEGVADLGHEYVKMFAYVGDQFKALAKEYTDFDARLKGKSPEQMQARLAREAALAGSQRLEQAAVEANDIAKDAAVAKNGLTEAVAKARENFTKKVAETEEKIYRKARLIASDEAKSFGVAALRAEKAQLENELGKYQAALEAIDNRGAKKSEAKRTADAETIETYQSLIDEAEGQLARLNKSLDNPSKMSREHRDLIKEQMRALEADLDKYESIMAATKALDNLMPDAKKESAAA